MAWPVTHPAPAGTMAKPCKEPHMAPTVVVAVEARLLKDTTKKRKEKKGIAFFVSFVDLSGTSVLPLF